MKLLLALILMALALGGSSSQASEFALQGFVCQSQQSAEAIGAGFEISVALGSKVAQSQKDCAATPTGHAILARNATVLKSFHKDDKTADLIKAEAFAKEGWKPVYYLRPRKPGTFDA